MFFDIVGPITFSFDAQRPDGSQIGYGNNNQNHVISFALLSSDGKQTSANYNTKEGDNLLTTTRTISFDIELGKLTGSKDLILAVYANDVTGSNSGIALNNFKLSYSTIPEPSAFGLLAGIGALALVASRRRRK